jgi:hypothetical protein
MQHSNRLAQKSAAQQALRTFLNDNYSFFDTNSIQRVAIAPHNTTGDFESTFDEKLYDEYFQSRRVDGRNARPTSVSSEKQVLL